MHHLSILEPMTDEVIATFAKKKDFPEWLAQIQRPPQEDYLLVSDNPPIFVVADGVTLDFGKLMVEGENYPDPSPAGDVAKIFCQAVIQNATEKYDQLAQEDINDIFKKANSEVEKYNQKVGPSYVSGNITGFYAATCAFVIIKEGKAYWASLCDAYVAHFDKDLNKKFITSGLCQPYAVVNGEERMAEQVQSGVAELDPGDWLFVFSDGFDHHISNPDFLDLFKKSNPELKEHIIAFSAKMNAQDPEHYGHERSLIAVHY